ncbi:MAG: hypothetical protein Q7T30_00575 [Planctomycetota bacterium]|nr:hypothetical protein [Planctomycetota bacterium]
MLFCHMTSRVEGDAHPKLLSEKGGTGFPYLVFMDGAGNVLAKAGDRSVAGLQKTREACGAYLELEKKVKAGDKGAATDFLIARLEMGQLKFADTKQAVADLGPVNAAQQKKIEGLVFGLEIQDMLSGLKSQEEANAAGRKFAAMMDEGRAPTGMVARQFYSLIASAAEADKDAKTFEKALKGLKEAVGDAPGSAKVFERMQQTLDKLKGEKK